METHHLGSAIPIAASSEPLPLLSGMPLLGSVNLQGETRAAIDKTLDRGPIVAATSGIAVEANHHCLSGRTSSQQTPTKIPGCGILLWKIVTWASKFDQPTSKHPHSILSLLRVCAHDDRKANTRNGTTGETPWSSQ